MDMLPGKDLSFYLKEALENDERTSSGSLFHNPGVLKEKKTCNQIMSG